MIKRTFGQVKTELSRVAGQTGMQATDPRLRELVNLAQERLSTMGEWPFQYARVKFCHFGGVLSLPCEYESLAHTAIEDQPVSIQPTWFEFLEYGPGPLKKESWSNLGLDLGESPVYRQPGTGGAKLRVASTNGDDAGNATVFGYDKTGVRREVTFALPDATSTVEWSKVTQVVKPVTAGDVVLSFTDIFGRTSQAAVYRSRDTSPTFRAYRFTGIADDQTKVIQGIVRRRLYPILTDNDEMFITNLGALRLGVKGIALEDKGDVVTAARTFELAKTILQDEARLYKGSRTSAPQVNVSRVASLSARADIY
jgi:hypothetical protein